MSEFYIVGAIATLGIGLGLIGIAFLRAIKIGNDAGKWEKDFYRIRDDLKFRQEQDQFAETEKKRLEDEIQKHKQRAITADDVNSLFFDAPSGNSDQGGPEGEKTTNGDDEEGVL